MNTKRALVNGALSGLEATGWMSVLMLIARKYGPIPKLPPRKIVEKTAENVLPSGTRVDERFTKPASVVAHFAFGAVAGAIFGAAQNRLKVDPVLPGIGFGLLVWAASYKGWIPALGILPRPEDDHSGRAATMLGAHVLYGAALGFSMRGRSA